VAAIPDPVTQPERNIAEGLPAKVRRAWQNIAECSEQISNNFAELQPHDSPSTLKAAWDEFEETSLRLLIEPVQIFLKRDPIRSALEAIEATEPSNPSTFTRSRANLDDRFQRLLTQTALDLCEPWRIWRGGNADSERASWERRRIKRNNEATKMLSQYERWAQGASSSAFSKDIGKSKNARSAFWWRQHRAVITTMEIEVALRYLTITWFDAVENFTMTVQQERAELLTYSSTMLRWMDKGALPGTPDVRADFSLITPEELMQRWAGRIETEAARALPENAEGVVSVWRSRLRSVHPRAVFLKNFGRYAQPSIRVIANREWNESAKVLRKVDQAREIVTYWSEEAASSRQTESRDLIEEARQNATSILTEQSQTKFDADRLDASVTHAFQIWRGTGLIVTEAELYGWVELLRKPRGRSLSRAVIEMGEAKTRAALHHTSRWTSRQVDRAMESFGGRIPAHPTLPAVVRRTTLRDTFALPAATNDLPVLYRLLFRVSPVEDRRFLIGRDQELAGLQQAVSDWASGRFAACLLIGARGSGKTSLLNCTADAVFKGQPSIRAKFHERILTPKDLDCFLCNLLGLSENTDLEAALCSERRVLILEEAERIYLRRVGGFAAVHRLTHLIHHTASATLWIIVMNDRSFRVLDAATHLHRVFSHRVNAMSVSRADLESAILERHRLSGLRLEFAPPPAEDPRVNRVKRLIGLEDSAQKLFFDSLFQQSEGIFRSAFQLWLSCIERVEGGTIRIRQPLDPAFARFRAELAQQDLFTLLVIQEHGSLTKRELAEVLCEAGSHSSARMERLFELGLLENDPDHPGPRVQPEAQRFVNDLLRRANLT
jgi:hypothetical protein